MVTGVANKSENGDWILVQNPKHPVKIVGSALIVAILISIPLNLMMVNYVINSDFVLAYLIVGTIMFFFMFWIGLFKMVYAISLNKKFLAVKFITRKTMLIKWRDIKRLTYNIKTGSIDLECGEYGNPRFHINCRGQVSSGL
jgi:hypothetical protein